MLRSNINTLDSVVMLECVMLIWLGAGKGFQTRRALVVPVRFAMLASIFNWISSRVREKRVLQSGRMTWPF